MNNPFERGEPPQVLTVSQLNRRARTLLESHFDFVWVSGEISNLAAPASGHWYFSLKDGDAQVRCAMFRNRNQRLRFTPEQGDEVRVRCRVSLYEGRGEFQLIVEHLELAGAGALQVAFEKLKAKLLAEGLFEQARKRPLPDEVATLGVVTSPTGAAIHDILTVLRRRCPAIRVYLLPVAVQGKDAAGQIVGAVERANRWHQAGNIQFDALIVGRGGGSLEDPVSTRKLRSWQSGRISCSCFARLGEVIKTRTLQSRRICETCCALSIGLTGTATPPAAAAPNTPMATSNCLGR